MHPRQRFPVQCFGLFFPAELFFILENRLHSSMSYGFAVIDGSYFYRAWEAFSKTKTGAVKSWLPKVSIMFPLFSYLCHKVSTHCSVAQTTTLRDGYCLYFPPFLEEVGWVCWRLNTFSAQSNFPGTELVIEVITLMLSASQKQTTFPSDCPLKMNICLVFFVVFCCLDLFLFNLIPIYHVWQIEAILAP